GNEPHNQHKRSIYSLFTNGLISLTLFSFAILFIVFLQYKSFKITSLFYQNHKNSCHKYKHSKLLGGGLQRMFSHSDLTPYIKYSLSSTSIGTEKYSFHSYIPEKEEIKYLSQNLLLVDYPFNKLISKLSIANLKLIGSSHGIYLHSKMNSQSIQTKISSHICTNCPKYVSIFSVNNNNNSVQGNLEAVKKYQRNNNKKHKSNNYKAVKNYRKKHEHISKSVHIASVKRSFDKNLEVNKKKHALAMQQYRKKQHFPPPPPSVNLQQTIIHNFCEDSNPSNFIESGCGICGKLIPVKYLQTASKLSLNMDVLHSPEVTQKERFATSDPIEGLSGPVVIKGNDSICPECYKYMSVNKRPLFSLANGMW